MNKDGPILVIEDDADDQMFLTGAFKEIACKNEVLFFEDGQKVLDYLQDESIYPFIILSDINLPRLNGFDLRKMIYNNEKLSAKCIPYLFFSTVVDRKSVFDAYTMSAQGFFLKPASFSQLVHILKHIIEYWKICYSPNHFNK